MTTEPKEPPDKSADIKNAAALLLKGGSLISEPCSECGGVQVKFKDSIICVNCRKKRSIEKQSNSDITQNERPTVIPLNSERVEVEIAPARFIIQDKILMLASQIRDECDLAALKQKADLMDTYLDILQKLDLITKSRLQRS
ncbi:MAG TPA: Sjogren's syndrome/scleroderma autoantigen 1 family protein [Nitrososphaeraceae archaeon]|nr:Sjogren's syndrome/scleroderma autoantigen 1 family protein [Nitrososphaeraceae archaeon]